MIAWGPDGVRTRADLAADVAGLSSLPVGRWLVVCRSRYRFAVAWHAALQRGAVVVLPSNHAPDALAAVASQVDAVLTDEDLPIAGAVRIDRLTPGAPVGLTEPADRVVAQLATSGSTGDARWHDKRLSQLHGEARALIDAFGIGPSDRFVVTVPAHHIYGLLFGVLVPTLAGAAFSDDTPLFPEAVAARLAGATVLVSVPAHLRALTGLAMPAVRRVFSSGAPLDAATAAALAVAPTEVFGSTETGGVAWRQQREDPRWTPLPGVHLDADADGRLMVRSPWIDGEGPWRADDRVRVDPDGRFVHLGRLDDVVKVASKRVSLGAIEAALLAVPGVRDVGVVLVDHAGRSALHAAYVGPPPDEVRAALRRVLEGVALPRLHRLDALPREPSGKLRRAALLSRLQPPPDESVVAADHPGFAGHFPGLPVLPGVIALRDLVLPVAWGRWPDLGRLEAIEVVTWHRPIRPGDAVRTTVDRDGARVRFKLGGPDGPCASGTLRFTEDAT